MAQYKTRVVNSDGSLAIVTKDGEVKLLVKDNPYFEQIIKLLRDQLHDKALEMMDLGSRIKHHSKGQFYLQDGLIFHKGTLMPKELSERIVQFADLGLPFTSLVNFWDRLMKNPSEDAKKDLFSFLKHHDVIPMEDGCFIAYKRVGEDWFDLHSHTIDNSVGKTPNMKREDVDPDRKNTCSRGLHVAAWKYAHDMYGNGNLIEVKVDPKDVVAVPEDYNGEKMRVCWYEVLKKVEGPRKTVIYAEYNVGSVVSCIPNMDDCQTNFPGIVIGVIEKEGEEPVYQIKKLDSEEVATFPQHNVVWLDSETCKNNDYDATPEELCPDCGEHDCICEENNDDDDYYDDDEDD